MKMLRMPIVKEGFQIGIPLLIISSAAILINMYLGLGLVIFSLGIMAFFRDPQREIKASENQFVSPADGTVVAIEEVYEDQHLKSKAKKIDIFLSIFNVHINYAPCNGKISFVNYRKGSFKNAFSRKASLANEHNLIGVENQNFKVVIKQIAGLIARRVVCYPQKGAIITKGQKIGLIKFSSRVEIFLPENTKLKVNLGDKVKGALSILGEI